MIKRDKNKSQTTVVLEWCGTKGIDYAMFQKMETLGYVKVKKDPHDRWYVAMINKELAEDFMSEVSNG